MLSFGKYIVRPLMERDREFLAARIAADPFHKDSVSVGWWYNNPPGENAWAVEDEQGVVTLYFKTQTACRFSLQFASEDRRTNWKVLTEGMEWLAATLTANKFREIITDSNGPELRAMATKRLGFLPAPPETLTRPLKAPNLENPDETRQEARGEIRGAGRQESFTDAATGQGRPLTPRVN
jgi:hypothetical protein